MRLVDANILVYAFTTSFPQHERARPISRDQAGESRRLIGDCCGVALPSFRASDSFECGPHSPVPRPQP